jgi:hypothetical protein
MPVMDAGVFAEEECALLHLAAKRVARGSAMLCSPEPAAILRDGLSAAHQDEVCVLLMACYKLRPSP